jgi:cytochrome c biogenesis protein
VLLEFLGSMNLAITLLVVVAIASIIGTVLQQNQPYPDYVLKFGPFWFEVFNRLGLYDVYGAGWFIAILAFLILSTSVCLYRQAPGMCGRCCGSALRFEADSLRGFQQSAEWRLPDRDSADATLGAGDRRIPPLRLPLADSGSRRSSGGGGDEGPLQPAGLSVHPCRVVVIGIGGLLDGNLWLKLKEWRGEITLETRDLAPATFRPPAGWRPARRRRFAAT